MAAVASIATSRADPTWMYDVDELADGVLDQAASATYPIQIEVRGGVYHSLDGDLSVVVRIGQNPCIEDFELEISSGLPS